MTSQFFLALLGFILLPTLVSRMLRIDRIFPLVFVQLLLGLTIHSSGADLWLQGHEMNLVHGPLADSLFGLGGLGISLLIALTGAESAPRDTGASLRFIPISVAGFACTCLCGSLIGYTIGSAFPELLGSRAQLLTFSFSIGLALSVTALPVLAAILRETGLSGTALGNLATNSAMLDDLWMWLGLATILSFSAAGKSSPLALLLLLPAYLATMLLMVRPLLRRWLGSRPDASSTDRILMSISVVFLSATATEFIGLHSILGAFVAGAILPREAVAGWRDPLIHFIQILLLPFFFILTGMRLEIDMHDAQFPALAALLTAAAVSIKFLSVSLTARCTGLGWRDALMLGSLMQCKGLMELVAINILFDAGIIGVQIFSALAMMALISTFITAPAMRLLAHARWSRRELTLGPAGREARRFTLFTGE